MIEIRLSSQEGNRTNTADFAVKKKTHTNQYRNYHHVYYFTLVERRTRVNYSNRDNPLT